MRNKTLLIFVLQLIVAQTFALQLASIFTNNMVLQRNTEANLWGTSEPNSQISIDASWGAKASCTTGADGNWRCTIATPKAGGPYTLKVTDAKTAITLTNILIGEVWICSGQSNMEMPLQGWPPMNLIDGAPEAIASANFPKLRFYTVARNASATPTSSCTGTWDVCSPNTAAAFSATAFFFGRMLEQELKIPVGLILTSWGGTPIEAWISGTKLNGVGEFTEQLHKITSTETDLKARSQWVERHPSIDISSRGTTNWNVLDLGDSVCSTTNFDDSRWPITKLPSYWETSDLPGYDGIVWYRRTFEIPAEWVAQTTILSLGAIDDMDVTYINGKRVGATLGDNKWTVNRKYEVPAGVLKAGTNTIAVKVIDTQGGGGMYGNGVPMQLFVQRDSTMAVDLTGSWKFLSSGEISNHKIYLYDPHIAEFTDRPKSLIEINDQAPSCLFNGMINPIVPFSMRGAIWYQGESNVGRDVQYQKLMPALIENWREIWNETKFPFYYVQIAPWAYGDGESAALLRDAQRKSLKVPATGMVVTLDIGNFKDIHPANKKDVGERLARWALAQDYGKKMPHSGPLYKSHHTDGNKLIVEFYHWKSKLVLKDAKHVSGFEIAGDDGKFYPAQARIKGRRIVLISNQVSSPKSVRYAWGSTPTATLFNKAGLPASSFKE